VVTIDGAASAFCDDESVAKHTTRSVRPLCVDGACRIGEEDRRTNVDGLFTETLDGPRLKF